MTKVVKDDSLFTKKHNVVMVAFAPLGMLSLTTSWSVQEVTGVTWVPRRKPVTFVKRNDNISSKLKDMHDPEDGPFDLTTIDTGHKKLKDGDIV